MASDGIPPFVRPQLDQLASELRLPDPVVDRTWRLYSRLYCSELDDIKVNPLCWLACIIVAEFNEDFAPTFDQRTQSSSQPLLPPGQLPRRPQAWTANVSTLLRRAGVHCKEFMKRMGSLTELGVYGTHTVASIRRLQRGYCASCALVHKLRNLVNDTVRKMAEDENVAASLSNGHGGAELLRVQLTQMTWVLYLLGKEHMMLRCDDLVTNFYLLLCCFVHTLKLLWPASTGRNTRTAKKTLDENVLMQDICQANHAQITEVNILFTSSSWESFINQCTGTSNIDSDIQRFRNRYLDIHDCSSSINELDFCDDAVNATLLPEGVSPVRQPAGNGSVLSEQQQQVHLPTSAAAALAAAPEVGEATPSVQASVAIPQTPVRAALTTVHQLTVLLAQASDGPNGELVRYLEECPSNPTEAIRQRIDALRARYESAFPSRQGSPLAPSPSERYQLAVRLYYRMLDSMLKAEEKRLGGSDFLSLLSNDVFNRALLTCCADVINKVYQCCDSAENESCAPVFDLHPYNLSKIIESFILAEPRLPKEIMQHLQAIENHVLEELAWKQDSPLRDGFTVVSAGSSGLLTAAAAAATAVPAANPEQPAVASGALIPAGCVSPARPVSSLQQFFVSPARPSGTVDRSGDFRPSARRPRSMDKFLNKVCRLGYQRLERMCTCLGIEKLLMDRIWTCFEYTLLNRWDLLQNRHIDQTMMCCIYGICKVMDNEIKFKKIVDAYKTTPAMRPEVYRSVYIADGEQPDSIIGFYNRIFMQSNKSYLLQFSPTSRRQPPTSPAPKSVTPGSPSMVRKNFYVSPLREPLPWQGQSSSTITLTPQSRQLYSFGEPSSTEKFRIVNEMIRMSAAQATSTRKRALNFDSQNFNGGEKPKDPASVRKQMRFDDDQPTA